MTVAAALTLLLLAIALTAGLAWFARRQWLAVREKEVAARERLAVRAAHEADLRLSLRVIAQAMLDGQCDPSEASLRIHTLLQGFRLDCDSRHALAAFSEHAAAIAHHPVGPARAALAPAERQRLDREREALEVHNSEALREAARRLLALLRAQ